MQSSTQSITHPDGSRTEININVTYYPAVHQDVSDYPNGSGTTDQPVVVVKKEQSGKNKDKKERKKRKRSVSALGLFKGDCYDEFKKLGKLQKEFFAWSSEQFNKLPKDEREKYINLAKIQNKKFEDELLENGATVKHDFDSAIEQQEPPKKMKLSVIEDKKKVVELPPKKKIALPQTPLVEEDGNGLFKSDDEEELEDDDEDDEDEEDEEDEE